MAKRSWLWRMKDDTGVRLGMRVERMCSRRGLWMLLTVRGQALTLRWGLVFGKSSRGLGATEFLLVLVVSCFVAVCATSF
jgi:hypothetical protein